MELNIITCDVCGESEEIKINIEYENMTEVEQYWIEDLKKMGWTYDKETDSHCCPTCTLHIEE